VTRGRSAYTLFELVLTTAVIAITAAVTVPSIDSMYPSYKLNASVDAIRAAWALGRAHAIEEGRPYRFAVAPGGNNYRLGLDEDQADGGQSADSDQNGNGNSNGQHVPPFHLEDHLPQGVTFAMAQEDPQSTPGSNSNGQSSPPQSSPSSDGLTTVAVFLPDGTARDDAEIRFQVKGALPKTIKLRALTGGVSVQQGTSAQPDAGGTR
jgi:type II secretory pathway pseudopilin PulG